MIDEIMNKIRNVFNITFLIDKKLDRIKEVEDINKENNLNVFEVLEYLEKKIASDVNDIEKYYLDYEHDNIYYATGYILYEKDNQWKNLLINENYKSKEEALKSLYSDFQMRMKCIDSDFKPTNFYFDKYCKIDFEKNFYEQVKDQRLCQSAREEVSAMAVVFYKDKVLTLEALDHKIILPKGHIEKNETNVETAIRECFEETGVILHEDDYVSEGKSYDYSFSGANFRFLPNSKFYEIFKVNKIHKKIKVCIFSIAEERTPCVTEHNNFLCAKWMNIAQFIEKAAHENDKKLIQECYNIIRGRK